MGSSERLQEPASPAGADLSDRLLPSTWAIGFAILASSLTLVLLCIHAKPFWVDELLEYYSDTKPSLGGVLFGQLHSPFSLEPPLFHLLEHLLDRIAPSHPEFSARLFSALCLPLIQLCVFLATLRLTGKQRPALFAMALPCLLATFEYAAEARVYSFLAALFAVAIVSYQAAIRPGAARRTLALAGVCCALSAATLAHYYGLFLVFPFMCGEAVRFAQRRRIDWRMAVALTISLAVFALNLPFMRALHEIQAHYYDTGETAWRMIPLTYAWFFAPDGVYFLAATRIGWQLLVPGATGVALLFFVALFRQWRAGDPNAAPMYAMLAGGCLLPVLNLAVAHFFTHAYVPRYCLPGVATVSIALAVMLATWFRQRWRFSLGMLVLGLLCVHFGVRTLRKQEMKMTASLAKRSVDPALGAALASVSDRHIYFQAVAQFATIYFYADPELKGRMVLVESTEKELFWLHRDPASIFARNMGITGQLPVMEYRCLQTQPGPHILIVFHDPFEEWIEREIEAGTIAAEPVGQALSGTIERVEFPAAGADAESQTTDSCVRLMKQAAP
jgi:Dolichyl-phosphate-mannose-protein mannosyltransferase